MKRANSFPSVAARRFLVLQIILAASYFIWVLIRFKSSGSALHAFNILSFQFVNKWGAGLYLTALLGLWSFHWFYFWLKLQRFVKNRDVPRRIVWTSLVVPLVAFLIAWANKFDSNDHFSPLRHPITRHFLSLGIQFGISWSLPFLFVANAVLVVLGILGFERIDPIQEKLNRKEPWSKEPRPRHEDYIKEALAEDLTYLGYEISKDQPVFLRPEVRNKHIQVLGSTGSGKTCFTLFPMLLQDIKSGRGLVFIDAKGSSDNAKAIFGMVKEAHREKDFLYFSLTDPAHSGTYNPLKHGNASQLKDKIAASIEWSEPFYQRICESALQTLFMDLEQMGRRVTLKELHECLKNPPNDLLNFKELADLNKSNIKTLESEINLLVNTPFGFLLSSPEGDIDLLDVYTNRKIAYFALDTQSYQHSAMRIGKIITQDLNTLSGIIESRFAQSEKKPLAITIDEYQAFGTKGFINALARGRASGFWITLAHQSLGDLKAIDDAYAQQVIENTNTKVFLRVNDPETAQLFSDSVGTKNIVETTSQVHIQGAEPKNIVGSQKVVQEYIIHPTELKNLEPGQAVFKTGQAYGRLKLFGLFPSGVEKTELPQVRRAPKLASPMLETPIY